MLKQRNTLTLKRYTFANNFSFILKIDLPPQLSIRFYLPKSKFVNFRVFMKNEQCPNFTSKFSADRLQGEKMLHKNLF